MISASYRAFEEICHLMIKLIRQFYTAPRCFRISGDVGALEFRYCSRFDLTDEFGGEPTFDIKVKADKKSAFSRAARNELACPLYNMGVFSPECSREAALCLSMMDFEGKDELMEKIRINAGGGMMSDDGQYGNIL